MIARVAIGSLVVVLALGSATWRGPSSSAHSLTALSTVASNICLSPGATSGKVIYSGAGPSDRTWLVEVGIGAEGSGSGIVTHPASFAFSVQDNSASVVGRYGAVVSEWIQVFVKPFRGSITGHASGTIDVSVMVQNAGTTQRCFGYYGSAKYW